MTTPLYPYIFVSARPDLDVARIPRYGHYNGQSCRIVTSMGSLGGRQVHEVEFKDGVRFWIADYEIRKENKG